MSICINWQAQQATEVEGSGSGKDWHVNFGTTQEAHRRIVCMMSTKQGGSFGNEKDHYRNAKNALPHEKSTLSTWKYATDASALLNKRYVTL